MLLGVSPSGEVFNGRDTPTPGDDPLKFFVPFVDFLMLSICRYKGKVTGSQALPLLSALREDSAVAPDAENNGVLGAMMMNVGG